MMLKTNLHLVLLSCIALPGAMALSYSTAIASKPNATPPSATPPITVQAIQTNDCARIQAGMTRVLKLRVNRTTAQFTDDITPAQGTACQLSVSTTGRNFPSIADLIGPLNRMLSRQGWVGDNRYAANGPEGAIAGYRKANSVVVLNIQSSLANSVICPDNVPIATCYQQAQPEEIIYRITLQAARQN